MVKVTENQDGTTTLSVSSADLGAVRSYVQTHAPGLRRLVQTLESPDGATIIQFLKSAVR